MFSERTSWDLGENPFSTSLRRARAGGRPLHDLTLSNPTHCGFAYATDLLLPLSSPEAARYVPDPLGMLPAREAVAAYYASHGAAVDPARITLTTSTSEAYSFLFRLLCDPGDEVLIAQPSYPLFEYIARLDGVVLREYPLHHDPSAAVEATSHTWLIDFAALRASISPRTRAVIVVHPNNPTGNYVSTTEREALEALCAEFDLALIVDEVFLDYALGDERPRSFATSPGPVLTFTLSGLSKVCALPQMKCSWIATTGPASLVDNAMARLEIVADTFLSMNAPIQHALPHWLARRGEIQSQILERIKTNLTALDSRLAGTRAQRLVVEGGWTTIVRVPREVDGITFAEAALVRDVITQPGDFYGLPDGRIVLSLLTPTGSWQSGLALLPLE